MVEFLTRHMCDGLALQHGGDRRATYASGYLLAHIVFASFQVRDVLVQMPANVSR